MMDGADRRITARQQPRLVRHNGDVPCRRVTRPISCAFSRRARSGANPPYAPKWFVAAGLAFIVLHAAFKAFASRAG